MIAELVRLFPMAVVAERELGRCDVSAPWGTLEVEEAYGWVTLRLACTAGPLPASLEGFVGGGGTLRDALSDAHQYFTRHGYFQDLVAFRGPDGEVEESSAETSLLRDLAAALALP